MTEQLSWRRLAWLVRNDVLRGYRSALVISGTAALIALAVSLSGAYDGDVEQNPTFYRAFFIAALFAWGTIATSVCFGDMHGRETNTAFLMLPASALEKTLSRLLIHSVGLVAYLLLFTTALSWVLEGINTLWIGERRDFFSPADTLAWLLVPHFIVVQALFFLGATWFRKVQFVKTVGAWMAVQIGLSALIGALVWVGGAVQCLNADCYEVPLLDWLEVVGPVVYFYLLPPFCWFVAWLRVTEAQVSHGV